MEDPKDSESTRMSHTEDPLQVTDANGLDSKGEIPAKMVQPVNQTTPNPIPTEEDSDPDLEDLDGMIYTSLKCN